VFNFFLVGAALFLLIYSFVQDKGLQPGGYKLSPWLWPRIIIYVFLLFFAVEVIRKRYFRVLASNKAISIYRTSQIDLRRLILSTVILVLYILAIYYLGFFLITPIFIFVFGLLFLDHNKATLLTFSLAFTVLIYLIFIKLLYLPLPKGYFQFFHNLHSYIY